MILLNSNKTYLKEIYNDYMPLDNYEEFLEIYNRVKNKNKYDFLFLDRWQGKYNFRINFNTKIEIE